MECNNTLKIVNFKKFKELYLPLTKKNPLLIYGGNRTGKTQILWAYLLFFRAHNLYLQKNRRRNLRLQDEAGSLLNSALSTLNNWNSFVRTLHFDKSCGFAGFEGKIDSNNLLKFRINTSGCLTINEFNGNQPTNKITYAHMQSSYQFNSVLQISDTITSCDQSLRSKYSCLNHSHKEEINDILKYLFEDFDRIVECIPPVLQIATSMYVVEISSNGDPIEIEIMVQSASFQKVFASLILLFTLLEMKFNNEEPLDRYYLIDEPDALLDQELAKKFCSKLNELSITKGFNLISTTSDTSKFDTKNWVCRNINEINHAPEEILN